MKFRALLTMIFLSAATVTLGAQTVSMQTSTCQLSFSQFGIAQLSDNAGHVMVQGNSANLNKIREVTGQSVDHDVNNVTQSAGAVQCQRTAYNSSSQQLYTVQTRYSPDASNADVLVEQTATRASKGLIGVQWEVAGIPAGMNIVLPAQSGIRLTRHSAITKFTFDYPNPWEAQLVIIEGPGYGFYIWAEDTQMRYKRLSVALEDDGWRLGFETTNAAPFGALTQAQSVVWHVNTYEGDWRVPAGRYRQWSEQAFGVTQLTARQPSWVNDIRCCLFMDMDSAALEELATKVDPAQTLLHTYNWRTQGYDVDYPSYDQIKPGTKEFLQRARQLGFHVQLHVNYFGVDVSSDVYPTFAAWHIKDPITHEKVWCEWTRGATSVKIAYINPAYKPWRDYFIAQMKTLCQTLPVDSIHLDQTLMAYNDDNGLCNGMSMIQGNLALHQELRQALPNVSLAGEGLNEVTYRHESFAQLQVWMMDPAIFDWNPGHLDLSHPISSYLFSPYTITYLYAGSYPATWQQLHAAYNDAYEHWGAIPTFRDPSYYEVHNTPSGFWKQLIAETQFMQQAKVSPSLDAAWPSGAAYVYQAQDGRAVYRTADHQLADNGAIISQTVTQSAQCATGAHRSIPGWLAFNEDESLGLKQTEYYPVVNGPYDQSVTHIDSLSAGLVANSSALQASMAYFHVIPNNVVADLTRMTAQMTGQVWRRSDNALVFSTHGQLAYENNDYHGIFMGTTDRLKCHPPFANGFVGSVTGRFPMQLPQSSAIVFRAFVGLEPGAASLSEDGVTATVWASDGHQTLTTSRLITQDVPSKIELDLTALAGQTIELALSVDSGPQGKASYDTTYWYEPCVLQQPALQGAQARLTGINRWRYLLCDGRVTPVEASQTNATVSVDHAKSIYLFNSQPPAITASANLLNNPFYTTYINTSGIAESAPLWAQTYSGQKTVAGVWKPCLITAPPYRGQTLLHFPLSLPADKVCSFRTFIATESSDTKTMIFRVDVNGQTMLYTFTDASGWTPVAIDLRPWRGQDVVLTLSVQAMSPAKTNVGLWAEPEILTAPATGKTISTHFNEYD